MSGRRCMGLSKQYLRLLTKKGAAPLSSLSRLGLGSDRHRSKISVLHLKLEEAAIQ